MIEALYRTYLDLKKGSGGDEHLIVAHAAIVLADSAKSRVACWATVAWPAMEMREPPEWALDRHTRRGRRLGRNWRHFWDEASRLERHEEHPLEQKYRAVAREAVSSPREPEVPDQDQLFPDES